MLVEWSPPYRILWPMFMSCVSWGALHIIDAQGFLLISSGAPLPYRISRIKQKKYQGYSVELLQSISDVAGIDGTL